MSFLTLDRSEHIPVYPSSLVSSVAHVSSEHWTRDHMSGTFPAGTLYRVTPDMSEGRGRLVNRFLELSVGGDVTPRGVVETV